MATTAKCGSTGTVSLGGEVTRWVVNLTMDTPDATSMASSGYREFLGCLNGGNGSFDTLVPAGVIGSHSSVDFTNDNETITGDIIVTDIKVTVPVEDKVVFTYDFVFTGAISLA